MDVGWITHKIKLTMVNIPFLAISQCCVSCKHHATATLPGQQPARTLGYRQATTPFTEHPCAPQVQALARLGCSRRACPAAVVSVPGQTPRSSPCEHPTFQLQSQLPAFPGHTQLPLTGITTPLHDASGTPSCATQVMHLWGGHHQQRGNTDGRQAVAPPAHLFRATYEDSMHVQ